MNRRGFLAIVLGCVVAPFVPHVAPAPRQVVPGHGPAVVHVVMTQRKLIARVRITAEALQSDNHDAWRRAVNAEHAGLLNDIDPPRGQHCLIGAVVRPGSFARYIERAEAAL